MKHYIHLQNVDIQNEVQLNQINSLRYIKGILEILTALHIQ